ncbi:MAG TPA: DUF4292 domain-containing protein [bacterium]|nr:DUF4292 domain-containing protein [bacterium]HQG46355.1 DUF4292 domain-containing protein [bacterium]HQI48076.1 DUF4292 domain-containing protein [bacterium]HQJ63306.1 DUF4292 domain-containing protein [bacterium]
MAVFTGSITGTVLAQGRVGILLAAILLCSGCAALRQPMLFPADSEALDLVLRTLENNYARIDHFEGEGRLSVAIPGRSVSLMAHLLIDRPDTLYVRLEALFGLDVGWLFCNRQHYRFYIPMENLYGAGPVDSLLSGSAFRLVPDYDELLSTLCGLERARGLTGLEINRVESRLILTGAGPLGRHTYWIDPKRGVVLQGQVCDSSGQVLLRQKYDHFKRINGVHIPQAIRVERPAARETLALRYEAVRINKKYSTKEIKTRIPASARKVRL